MDNSKYKQVSEFRLKGRFLGFASDTDGKLKYLRLAVEEKIQDSGIRSSERESNSLMNYPFCILNSSVETREVQIKLSKESRASLIRVLQPGDWIQVYGEKKLKGYTGQFKLKAYQVNKCVLNSEQTMPPPQVLPSQTKAKILVCQKSGCLKRGGKRLCQALETALCDRGLQEQVSIERTGCLKRCSQAPNMVLMPGKTRVSGMKPDAIATLLENLVSS